jgi:hypothetical protein
MVPSLVQVRQHEQAKESPDHALEAPPAVLKFEIGADRNLIVDFLDGVLDGVIVDGI